MSVGRRFVLTVVTSLIAVNLFAGEPQLDSDDPYERLGIDWFNPTAEDVLKVFTNLANQYRPGGPWREDEEKMQIITDARDEILARMAKRPVEEAGFNSNNVPPQNHEYWKTSRGKGDEMAFRVMAEVNKVSGQLHIRRNLMIISFSLATGIAGGIAAALNFNSLGFNFGTLKLLIGTGTSALYFSTLAIDRFMPTTVDIDDVTGVLRYNANSKNLELPSVRKNVMRKAVLTGVIVGSVIGFASGFCARALRVLGGGS